MVDKNFSLVVSVFSMIIIRHHSIIRLEKLLVRSSKIVIQLQTEFSLFLTFQVFLKSLSRFYVQTLISDS